MEERSPLHNLTIAVDNFDCVPGIEGSCAKGIILKYQNSTATLTINPDLFAVQVGYNAAFNLFIVCHVTVYIFGNIDAENHFL